MTASAAVRISIVTPTHNRPASLLRLLRALRDGTYPTSAIEAVIVADGCTDDTVAQVRAEPLPFHVRVVEQNPGRGAAAARNLGATLATGELLVFLDDDIEPFPQLLAEHWREYETSKTATAVVGPPRPVRQPNAGLHAIAAWTWWEQQFARMQQPGHRFTYDNVFSGNLSLPRSLFASVGGFDVEFNSCRDDSEFGLRMLRKGARVTFAAAAAAWHHELRDTAALNRRKQAEGIADVRLTRLYPELWPSLKLAIPDQHPSRAFNAMQRLAFDAPRLGRVAAGFLERLLTVLEGARMRATWRTLQGGLMYYWYWVGVARAVSSRSAFNALRADCRARAEQAQPADLEIDLAQGLELAEEALDAAQPDSATIRWGSLHVGRIPWHPGAEPLGGRHLRPALSGELAQSLTSTLAIVASGGSPVLRHADVPAVSIIIPAYNAGATLGETLDSLIRQTSPHWEAIVVDDGSTDDTAEIAARSASRDGRIRVLRQSNGGEGAARNSGFAAAQCDWVLFLDADDWLLPNALEALARAVLEAGTLDVIHAGWSRVAADGTVMEPEYLGRTGDLFDVFARRCAIPIHCAIVRRSAALAIGGFDTTLKTCADWDFWQRLARSGTRFGRVRDVVAHYRMRPGSSSTLVPHLWRDGLRVMAQGHTADTRAESAAHATGQPREELANARFEYASWVAGFAIGVGMEPAELLAELAHNRDPGLSPEIVARYLFNAVPYATARSLEAWDELWPALIPKITAFLTALEQKSQARLLTRRTLQALERLTLDVSLLPRPFTRGSTYAFAQDVAAPSPWLAAPAGVERAHGAVLADGQKLGSVHVPIGSDAAANERTIAEEIVARYAWSILGWYLRGGAYGELAMMRSPQGITVSRHGAILTTNLSDTDVVDAAVLHDRIGWTVFLQELWGRSDWTADRFYDAQVYERALVTQHVATQRLTIDVSDELPALRVASGIHSLELDVRVGGAPLGIVTIPIASNPVGPAEQRGAITFQSAFALCRTAVREGVLWQPRGAAGTLRERLARRRSHAGVFTAMDRTFPPAPNESTQATRANAFDRHHFESVFAASSDPWSYVTPYEQLKYEQTLSLLPEGAIGRVLELACAEGRFTRQLASRAREVLATDISTVALDRARAACGELANVRFAQLDLIADPIPNGFDVIVCSEVLYYVGSADTLMTVGAKLRDALAPGGLLILAHTNVAADDANETGLAWDVPFGAKRIGELLARVPNVRFVQELRTELYRVQVFCRRENRDGISRAEAEVVVRAPHLPPAPHVAARFRRPHERRIPGAAPEGPTTRHVPILMYHQVAPNGDAPRSRYRVTPEQFAAQLAYLDSAGFRGATLSEWHSAMHYRRPLPGRAVVFTFDDGYRDFVDHAFPLLQKHGYPATIFMPGDFIGKTNAWDATAHSSIPILGWDELRSLAARGVAFGAHSMSHTPLTGLANSEVLREASESKAILERGLGVSVTTFAYPHGETDAVVQQLVAQCGYVVAVSTDPGRASFTDPIMALPRIEVSAYDDLTTFIAKLGA